MTTAIDMGLTQGGQPALLDLAELLATRLLVQGNSGSGKSHLLRRLLEQSAPLVQQAVIDPEGDFVSLAEQFGHVVVDAECGEAELQRVALRVRQHRVSVVLNLENLEADEQLRATAAFLGGLFDVDRSLWFPMLIVVDEAQLFAPVMAGEASDEARRLSLGAMTNLMCRGRKRGLAGVIATQRLAKLAKNVAAEASNFLMGRTFLDIDMARAADLLGMERREAEKIRDLERGHFLGLGPAIARRPVGVRIADVQTRARNVVQGLMPLPNAAGAEMESILLAEPLAMEPPSRAPEPVEPVPESGELLEQIAGYVPASEQVEPPEAPSLFEAEETAASIASILAEMAAEQDCTFQPAAQLYQDFTVRCRMLRILPGMDLGAFRRRFAMAVAGIYDDKAGQWQDLLRIGKDVPEDLLAPFLMLARAAVEGAPCPDDERLAEIYGTRSSGRIRRLLEHLEKGNLIVVRTDYGGRRSVGIPALGMTTAPVEA